VNCPVIDAGFAIRCPLRVELIAGQDPACDMGGFTDTLQAQDYEGERLMK